MKLINKNIITDSLTSRSNDSEGWGMGFFLVFFPQDHHFKSSFKPPTITRPATISPQILAKTQSTLSICAFLIFLTLLLFTLSTFEPNNSVKSSSHTFHYRRHLYQSNAFLHTQKHIRALQGLGTLYLRGTKSMNDVVLCHITDHVIATEIKSFLRAFHRSGLFSKSDLVFIFNSITTPENYDRVIRDENDLFLKLIQQLSNQSHVSDFSESFSTSFDVSQFVKSGKEFLEKGESIWGKKVKNGLNSSSTELTRTSYGSVVGFGVGELDPENSLSGFLDHVPMSLRRWASYPMILGRLRRNYKHVMLVDVKEVLLLSDPLGRVRKSSSDSVFLSSVSTKHGKTEKKTINPAVIIGNARGVRRFSAAMLTEIVRATSHNKRKTPVTEQALLSRLANNEFIKRNIRLVDSAELIQESSSLSGVVVANNTVIRRGNSNIDIDFMKHICSFRIEASVYTECEKVQPF